MLALKQKSKTSPRTAVFLSAVLLTLAVTALVRPAAGLAAPGEPVLSFEPGSHDFGLQPVYNSAQASFQVRNEGAEEAWIELQTVGPDAGSFWVGSSDCWSGPVQPGATCSLEVNFNPSEPLAEYMAQVRARSNGFDFYADLSGVGASPWFTSEPNPVDFGVAAVDGEGRTREIEVVNAGNWPGGVFIAVISGGAVGSFQLLDENCTNRLIAPSEGCSAQVRFRPISTGVKRATLSLFGESDGGSQVTLTGVGSAPAPAPAAPPAPAGAVAAGTVTVIAPAARNNQSKNRAHKRKQRVQRKRRIQRRLRIQRRQRSLRRQRALRRHGRQNRTGLRGRRSIGG